jgi:hypothetical protein
MILLLDFEMLLFLIAAINKLFSLKKDVKHS